MRRTRIKVCGVRDVATARVCAEAGVDAVGVVFAPGSAREVTLDEAAAVCAALPPFVVRVGLFVDAEIEDITRAHERCGFGLVQLHGGETERDAEEVWKATGVRVLRALRFDAGTVESDLARWKAVEGVAGVLLDGSAGGQGEAFRWDALGHRAGPPIVVAGGLEPDNVGDALRATRAWGVDVSSGVESSRGVKSHDLIRAFVRRVRDCDASSV